MTPTTRSSAFPEGPHNTTLDDAVLAEIQELRARGELTVTPHTQSRCHICCEVESKVLVNKLLAAGLTNREITEMCMGINARRREAGDERMITARTVWVHRTRHFNLDDPAQALYREIAERRAGEQDKDFVNGVGHAITPLGLIETVMVKSYSEVTRAHSKVSVRDGLAAAVKLHEITSRDASQRKMADLLHQMDKIIAAAQEFVPPEQHEAFLARVEGRDVSMPMRELTDRTHQIAEKAIRDFIPPTTMDDRDEI